VALATETKVFDHHLVNQASPKVTPSSVTDTLLFP